MLRRKLIKGVGWSVSGRLLGRLIDMATLLILARILVPADFGLTALAFSIVTILDMVLEVPLVQALTRLRTLEKDHYDTAFTLGVLRGVLFTVLVVAAAWPFAQFYKDDRLFSLVAVLSLAPAARSLYSPKMADYMRELRFAPMFVAQIVGKVLAAALALWVLWTGGGYWAIAVNNVAASAAATVVSYIIAPYRPALSLGQLKAFSGFLGWFSLSQIVAALNWQFDRFVLGAGISKSDLGQYTMAGDLAVLPTQSLIGPAMQPVMAAFSRLNDDDERLRHAFLRAGTIMMMAAAPICILIFAAAEWITAILFNDQWEDIALYLSLLSLTVLPVAYYQVFYSLALAADRTRMIFQINSIDLAARLVLIPAGLYAFSVLGVIAARGACAVLIFALSLYYAKELIGVRIIEQLRGLSMVALACLAMGLALAASAGFLAGVDWHPVFELTLSGLAGGSVYLAALNALGARKLITNR